MRRPLITNFRNTMEGIHHYHALADPRPAAILNDVIRIYIVSTPTTTTATIIDITISIVILISSTQRLRQRLRVSLLLSLV